MRLATLWRSMAASLCSRLPVEIKGRNGDLEEIRSGCWGSKNLQTCHPGVFWASAGGVEREKRRGSQLKTDFFMQRHLASAKGREPTALVEGGPS